MWQTYGIGWLHTDDLAWHDFEVMVAVVDRIRAERRRAAASEG